MWNGRLDEAQTGIKTAGRNIKKNLRYTDDITLMLESKEELNSLLIKMKDENEKAGLKLNIEKTKIMVSSPITSWQMGKNGNSDRLVFLRSKITVEGDCSHEIKRHLLLGRKAMINLDNRLKNRHITLLTKIHLVKTMVFPVIMYGCESWTIEKAEWWRIDAFELWCWKRLLRVPWTARRLNKSILKKINPEYSLERLMLKLKLQHFGHLMQRTNSLEKTLMLGKIEGRRRRGWQRMRWLDGITDSTWVWASSGRWRWTLKPGMLRSMGLQRVRHHWAAEQQCANSFVKLFASLKTQISNPPDHPPCLDVFGLLYSSHILLNIWPCFHLNLLISCWKLFWIFLYHLPPRIELTFLGPPHILVLFLFFFFFFSLFVLLKCILGLFLQEII